MNGSMDSFLRAFSVFFVRNQVDDSPKVNLHFSEGRLRFIFQAKETGMNHVAINTTRDSERGDFTIPLQGNAGAAAVLVVLQDYAVLASTLTDGLATFMR